MKQIRPKTEQELRALAKNVYEGQVFLTNDPERIRMCFMVLLFVDSKDLPDDVGAVYENMSEAGPRSINGLPIFMSCKFLSIEETNKVDQYIKEYKELMKGWEN